jgi:hypothetical protein
MQRVLAQARAVLLDLDLLHAAGDFDLRAVVQIARFRALQPHHFAVFFCHFTPIAEVRMQNAERASFCILHSSF